MGVFLIYSYLLRQGFSQNLEGIKLARVAGQQFPWPPDSAYAVLGAR